MTDESLYPRWPEKGRLIDTHRYLPTEDVSPNDALGRQCYDWGDDARSLVTIASVVRNADLLVTDVRYYRNDGTDQSVHLRGLPQKYVEVMVRPAPRAETVCCNACGSLVGDWELHEDWHRALERNLSSLEGGEEED